jgi:hypothetical protein
MKDNLLDGEYLITKEYTEWLVKTGGFARDMTLRDHYAGLAMQAQLSMPEMSLVISQGTITTKQVCGSCYQWADAMLKERAK